MVWILVAAIVIVFLACALLALVAMVAIYALLCITLWRLVFELLDRS